MKGELTMNEKRRKLLDSFAVLVWLGDEPGAQKVENILRDAEAQRLEVFMNVINLGEVYYMFTRRFGQEKVVSLRNHFLLLPITIVTVDEELVFRASAFKARFPISFADCIAIATAAKFGATLITGDPDFKAAEEHIDIEWLR